MIDVLQEKGKVYSNLDNYEYYYILRWHDYFLVKSCGYKWK